MTHIQATIPEENLLLVKQLIQKLGGELSVVNSNKSILKKKKTAAKSKKKKALSPTYLFGKWKDLNLDPETYRDTVWRKTKISL